MTISIIFLALSANNGAAGLMRFRKHLKWRMFPVIGLCVVTLQTLGLLLKNE